MKILKVMFIITVFIILLICGLMMNNRIYFNKYSRIDTSAETLTDHELTAIASIYQYIKDFGNDIYDGFSTQSNLIIYNREYEFLFTDDEYENEWKFISYSDIVGKNIYRRKANKPKAFAVKIQNHWAGSFPTYDYYHVSFFEKVPIIVPPQIFSLDDVAYKSVVIHEMVHALQGNRDSYRVEAAEYIGKVLNGYYGNSVFNNQIKQEGKILEEAVNLTDKMKIAAKMREFIETRDDRRNMCGMTDSEIFAEKEYEWLEGMARYAEYIASAGSKSKVAKNLGNIAQKTAEDDGRYYVLGMAEIILINKLNIIDWQHKLFYDKYTPEDILREYLSGETR